MAGETSPNQQSYNPYFNDMGRVVSDGQWRANFDSSLQATLGTVPGLRIEANKMPSIVYAFGSSIKRAYRQGGALNTTDTSQLVEKLASHELIDEEVALSGLKKVSFNRLYLVKTTTNKRTPKDNRYSLRARVVDPETSTYPRGTISEERNIMSNIIGLDSNDWLVVLLFGTVYHSKKRQPIPDRSLQDLNNSIDGMVDLSPVTSMVVY